MKNFFRNHDNTIDPYDSIPLQPPTISTAGEATHQFSRVHVEGKVREREREKKKARQEELEANIDTKRGYKRRREREREREKKIIYTYKDLQVGASMHRKACTNQIIRLDQLFSLYGVSILYV